MDRNEIFKKVRSVINNWTLAINSHDFRLADCCHTEFCHFKYWDEFHVLAKGNTYGEYLMEKYQTMDEVEYRRSLGDEYPCFIEPVKTEHEYMYWLVVHSMEALARKWHAGQFRKGPGNVPYIVHPEAVAKKLRDWGYNDREDAVTLAVAWGHDLLEDTKCPEEDIIAAGGAEVLAGIKALSFLPPKTQPLTNEEWDKKKDEYIHNVAATAAPEILVVKMADRICNTMDFIRANNKWGYEYLVLGECLFDRVREMKKGERIAEEFDYVQTLTTTLESGGFDKESYDEWSERLRLDMP